MALHKSLTSPAPPGQIFFKKVCLFFTVLAGLGISEAYFLNREDKNVIATAHPMGVARATGHGRRNDSVELAEQLLSESPAGRN